MNDTVKAETYLQLFTTEKGLFLLTEHTMLQNIDHRYFAEKVFEFS